MNARDRIILATVLGFAVTACSGVGSGGGTLPHAGAVSVRTAGQAVRWSPNLIVNGDAEFGDATASGYDAVTIPGWQPHGLPTVVAYGAKGFPTSRTPGPPARGKQFFSGGQLGDSTLSQIVDVSKAASQIDNGAVAYILGGWLGGYKTQADNARVAATFYGASGATLGTALIGPVTAAERKNQTAFVYRQRQAGVPKGTRTIGIVLRNTRVTGYDDGYADDLSLTLSAALSAPPAPAPPPVHVPAATHVYEIMMENEWLPEIVGNKKQAPYINSLIPRGALLANMFSVAHPSDPNYVAIASGSTYGLKGDDWPTTTIDERHLGDLVQSSGRSWKVYMESANGPCDRTQHGYYYPDDSPYMYFKDVRDDAVRCAEHIVPIAQLAKDMANVSTAPNYAWIAPDDCDDMESCGIAAGDAWLSRTIPLIMNSQSWKAGHSMLIVTWDEDDYKHDQNIPCFVIGAGVKPGSVSHAFYTHYSTLHTIEAAFGLPALTLNDEYAAPFNDIWN